MKSKDLLSKLSVLEMLLIDFSFEELNANDAVLLKKSYEVFREDLENLIFGRPSDSFQQDLSPHIESENLKDESLNKDKQRLSSNNGRFIQNNISTMDDRSSGDFMQGISVLIFEDDFLSQRLIEQQFISMGCYTEVTDNAQYGLDILESKKIDLVLMDLRMPGMTGFEITDLIRNSQLQKVRIVPIIAMSADFDEKQKKLCSLHGMNDFILKPCNLEELKEKIIGALDSLLLNLNQIPNKPLSVKPEVKKMPKIDFTQLVDDCMGELSLVEELLRLLKQNIWEFIGATKIYIQNEDFDQLAFEAHKMKNGLGMINAHSLQTIVFEFNEICKSSKEMPRIEVLRQYFIEEFIVVEKAIDVGLTVLINDKKRR